MTELSQAVSEMKRVLERYNKFQECVLTDIVWTNQGTSLEIVFDYIWGEDGKIRSNVDQQAKVVLRFSLVQEFHMRAGLNQAMLAEPDRINWGINEIALVDIDEDETALAPYCGLSLPFYHAIILWETERRIDIVFSHLDVVCSAQ